MHPNGTGNTTDHDVVALSLLAHRIHPENIGRSVYRNLRMSLIWMDWVRPCHCDCLGPGWDRTYQDLQHSRRASTAFSLSADFYSKLLLLHGFYCSAPARPEHSSFSVYSILSPVKPPRLFCWVNMATPFVVRSLMSNIKGFQITARGDSLVVIHKPLWHHALDIPLAICFSACNIVI